jgi:tetrahydromethanopterin S-methyltransferase subunit G
MKQNLFALFAAAALLLGMSACTNVDNPSSGQEDVVVAPAQLKQGIWTEYDEALLTSGKYTLEQLAQMPTVGMWIEGDKGYFFTYTAEEASETVEGKISYNNKTGKGTITFPTIKDSPLSGQTVNFTATSDETMEFEITYEGQKTTSTCAWLCENLDNWFNEITDEDWKALMDFYELIAADRGPDASINWGDSEVEGLDQPQVWNEVAASKGRTRAAGVDDAVMMGIYMVASLFEPDPFEEVNAKLDNITGKLDEVLAGQEKILNQMNLRFDQMDQKLNEINARLIAIAEKQNQQETVNIFNKRNETYFNPLKVRNTSYFDDAYKLYIDNKSDLSKVSSTLGEYAKAWAGNDEKYIELTWQYMEYLTNVQHSTYGTGMDRIYDGVTFDKYPWEHMGIGDRQTYRAYDLFMLTKSLFMISLYSTYCDLADIQKRALYNNYKTYKPKLLAFSQFKVSNPDKYLVCQIPGAHFVMHKELQKYNYKGKNNEAPHPAIFGQLAVYRPEWHEAGSITIENPIELKSKLIRWKEIFAMQKYFKSAVFPNIPDFGWYEMLVEGKEAGNNLAGGAVYAKEPTTQVPSLLLNEPEYGDPNEVRCDGVRAAGRELNIGPVATAFWDKNDQWGMRNEYMGQAKDPQNGKSLWMDYRNNEYYAAIVEKRY